MNINIITPLLYTGYGIAGFNIVKSLHEMKNKVSLYPIGQPNCETQEQAALVKECIINNQMVDFNAPCLRIYHQFSMAEWVGSGKKIGFPIFELDKFSSVEKHHLNFPDRLLVCSQWAKEVIKNEIGRDAHVVPLGVDTNVFRPEAQTRRVDGPYIFLNCGKWEVRKGHDLLVNLFNKAFSPSDNVELWLCPHNPFLTENEIKEWHTYYLNNNKMGKAGKIKIWPRVQTQAHLANIMNNADCGIFPYRAEGWNMEGLEMLACGKPIIATHYSGPTEYLHSPFLSDSRCCMGPFHTELEDAYDGKWFFKQGKWAALGKLEQEHFIENMRFAATERFQDDFGIKIAKKYTWQNTVEKLLEIL